MPEWTCPDCGTAREISDTHLAVGGPSWIRCRECDMMREMESDGDV